MATGEWIHDYLNRSGGGNPVKRNKSVNNGQRLYVAAQGLQPPSSVDNKRNIKRSWTISSKNPFCFYHVIRNRFKYIFSRKNCVLFIRCLEKCWIKMANCQNILWGTFSSCYFNTYLYEIIFTSNFIVCTLFDPLKKFLKPNKHICT